MDIKQIDNWSVLKIPFTINKGTPEETTKIVPLIVGTCEGQLVKIAYIKRFDPNGNVIYPNDKIGYMLGNPLKGYVKRYPNAKEALILGLKKNKVNIDD